MFEQSNFMELFVIMIIAAALIYKFYMTLGERRGYEGPSSINAVFTAATEAVDMDKPEVAEQERLSVPESLKESYEQIRVVDPRFSLTGFLNGAAQAFEMVLQAYAQGDREMLKPLLSDKVYADFDAALVERDKKQQKLSTTLVKLNPITLEDMSSAQTVMDITLKFTSEQTNIVYDKDNKIVEGSANQIEEVIDVWTFRRDARSSNPNWVLVETGI